MGNFKNHNIIIQIDTFDIITEVFKFGFFGKNPFTFRFLKLKKI